MADGLLHDEALREARRRLGSAGRDPRAQPGREAAPRPRRARRRPALRFPHAPPRPVVSAAAILSLALAIGGCTAAFALVDALILRPLPVRDPARLVSLGLLEGGDATARRSTIRSSHGWSTPPGDASSCRVQLPVPEPRDIRRDRRRRTRVRAVRVRQRLWHARRDAGSRARDRSLRRRPGRPPATSPCSATASGSGDSAGDPHVIGRTVTLGRKTFQIVGVARDGFTGIEPGIAPACGCRSPQRRTRRTRSRIPAGTGSRSWDASRPATGRRRPRG